MPRGATQTHTRAGQREARETGSKSLYYGLHRKEGQAGLGWLLSIIPAGSWAWELCLAV